MLKQIAKAATVATIVIVAASSMLMPTTAGSANSKGAPAPRTASPDGLHYWVPRSTVTALDLPSPTTTDQISNDLYGNVRSGTAPASVNAVDLPGKPDAPMVTATGPTSLYVNWTLPDANGLTITGYSIQFRKKDEDLNWTYWFDNGNLAGTNDTITTLKPETEYEVEVRVHAGNVGSQWSEAGIGTTSPFEASIALLFPNGDAAKLEFMRQIAGDADGNGASHAFRFQKPGETETLTPAQALITVVGPDFTIRDVEQPDGTMQSVKQPNFTIQPVATTTPAQFRTVYGGANSVDLSGILIASNTTGLSTRLNFSLNLTYDYSAQFGPPAVYQSDNRWKIPTLEVYEGPNAAASFNWSASQSDTAVDRRWLMAEEPNGEQATVSCNYDGATSDEVHINWPNTDHDSYLFNPVNRTTDPPSYPSGTVTVSFDNSNPNPEDGDSPLKYPDYENPHDHDQDNTYHLRVINDNNVDTDLNVGCNGSAIDITVKIKDVGAPNPPTNFVGEFNSTTPTTINLTWTEPTTFQEDGEPVNFPHPDFNPSSYSIRHRYPDTDPWVVITDIAGNSGDIKDVTDAAVEVQIQAINSEVNSENPSEWTQSITIGTLGNRAPTVNAPTNAATPQTILFPHGKNATITYDAEPGTDPDGDPDGDALTYSFSLVVDSTPTSLADSLLTVARDGNDFTFTPADNVSPQDFQDTYGTTYSGSTITASIVASDVHDSSEPETFLLAVHYDLSAHFSAPATPTSDNRYVIPTIFGTYEGPNAGQNLPLYWESIIAAVRDWGTGNPSTPAVCRTDGTTATTNLSWPTEGAQDSADFNDPTQSTTKAGFIIPNFASNPDFENPDDDDADNLYLVRYHNIHTLHNPSIGDTFPSCSGSAIDIQIQVKDVGVPAGITPSGDFDPNDHSKIHLSWATPTGFLEGGVTVPFPDATFETTSYRYRYRPANTSDSWTVVKNLTALSATIDSLTGTSYEIAVRARNSEGRLRWDNVTSITITLNAVAPEKPDAPTTSAPGQTSIAIEWTAPNDNGFNITDYQVQYRVSTDTNWTDHTHSGTTTNTTILGLNSSTSYAFRVSATNVGGDSLWSDHLTESTTDPPPPKPTITISALDNQVDEGQTVEFSIDISPSNTVIVHYTYEWTGDYSTSTDTGGTTSIAGTSGSFRVPTQQGSSANDGSLTVTLSPNAAYTVGSPNSSTVTINRLPELPEFDQAPSVTANSSTSLRISWDQPDSQSQITDYQIQYRKTGIQSWSSRNHNGTATTTNDIGGLDINSQYQVQVRATNSDGTGPWSDTGLGSTHDLQVSIRSVKQHQRGRNCEFHHRTQQSRERHCPLHLHLVRRLWLLDRRFYCRIQCFHNHQYPNRDRLIQRGWQHHSRHIN